MDETLELPTLDLADVSSTDPARQERASRAILEGFGRYGLLYVKGHEVPPVAPLYDQFAAFCARGTDAKQPFNRADIWYQRGWTPPNTERAVIAGGQPDFKECWFAAPIELDPECVDEFPEVCSANVWPEDAPEFREWTLRVGRELHLAGMALLRQAARALGLESDAFATLCEGAPHVFRLLKYLPLEREQIEGGVLWGEEHTDFNLLTLLPGGQFFDPDGRRGPAPDSQSGLYLRTRPSAEFPKGQRIRPNPPAGCLVAQVGQELEILTGGKLTATPHEVTAPKTPGWSRFSAAHFIHLHPRAVLSPLRPFRTKEALRAYSPPTLAGTYAQKTLVDIGLAPSNALDALGYRHYDRLVEQRAEGPSS